MKWLIISSVFIVGYVTSDAQISLLEGPSEFRQNLPSGLSSQVARTLGAVGDASPSDRIREAQRISIVSEEDIEGILFYLKTEIPQSTGVFFNDQSEHQLRNTLMNRLHQSPVSSERIAACYLEIIANREMDIVLRDYAVQHLGNLISRTDCSGVLTNRVVDTLFSLIDSETKTTVSGTAVLALRWILEGSIPGEAKGANPVDTSELLRACGELARNSDAAIGSRASAVATAGYLIAERDSQFPEWIANLLVTLVSEKVSNADIVAGDSEDKEAQGQTEENAALVLACAAVVVESGEQKHRDRLSNAINLLQKSAANDDSVFLLNLLKSVAEGDTDSIREKKVLP